MIFKYYSVNVFLNVILPRYGRARNNSLYSTVNVMRVCKNFLFKKVSLQLSTNLMENTFFLTISFKWLTSVWNLEKSKTIENVLNKKIKITPILYWILVISIKVVYTLKTENQLKKFLILVFFNNLYKMCNITRVLNN